MDLIVAPNGVALSEEAQQQAQNPPLLWTLAGVAGALIRATRDPGQTVELGVHVARSDDVAIVWLIERWVLHASYLLRLRRAHRRWARSPASTPPRRCNLHAVLSASTSSSVCWCS